MKTNKTKLPFEKFIFFLIALLSFNTALNAQVILEKEILITNNGLHFDGVLNKTSTRQALDQPYDRAFGDAISAHGDCIKTYNEYVFMTWYKGGKNDRHVMLTRHNTKTGSSVTIEFPHRHTGYLNQWWIGEAHNVIGIGVSPLNGTIHLVYDMHAYSRTRPTDESFSKDYFRYSYSVANAVSLPDNQFTIDKFVQSSSGNYKHLSLNGPEDYTNFNSLTYPEFFLNDDGELFLYMREGGDSNGGYKFSKYNASTSKWSNWTFFNALNAKSQGADYNWGLYGSMKYLNGKIRIGFQRRSANNNDKFALQNGIYYAYSDNQDGLNQWKNHKGQNVTLPVIDADVVKVMEPGDLVNGTNKDAISISPNFDWTVTKRGDIHIISRVRDGQFNVTKYLHTYKPAGATDFVTTDNFVGAEAIYTAGNDIFIIGLTNNKVFIDKAAGGTNNFTRVYQATSGKNFNHGQVYIKDGKLYYYLMEKVSGNARPLYLQIIDLDITPKSTNMIVHIKKADASNYALDGGFSGANDQNVYLWNANENNINQQWIEIDRGNGYYSYQKRNTNYCMDGGNNGANNQNVKLWTCSETNENQQWRKVSLGNNTFQLVKRNASTYAIDGGNAGAKGQNVKLWLKNSTNGNQKWTFKVIGNATARDYEPAVSELESLIKLYPNPVANQLNIDLSLSTTKNYQLDISDISGRIVFTKDITNENLLNIDVSSYKVGMYFVRITNEIGNQTINFIKE